MISCALVAGPVVGVSYTAPSRCLTQCLGMGHRMADVKTAGGRILAGALLEARDCRRAEGRYHSACIAGESEPHWPPRHVFSSVADVAVSSVYSRHWRRQPCLVSRI
jgi:hypothetical protein